MARGSHVRWSDSAVRPWSASDSYGSFTIEDGTGLLNGV